MVAQSVFLPTWSDRRNMTDVEMGSQLKEIKVCFKSYSEIFASIFQNLLGCPMNINKEPLIFEGKEFLQTFDSQVVGCQFPGADLYKEVIG